MPATKAGNMGEDEMMHDFRYDYATCIKCGMPWQWIDFGCALHAQTCRPEETIRETFVAEQRLGHIPPNVRLSPPL